MREFHLMEELSSADLDRLSAAAQRAAGEGARVVSARFGEVVRGRVVKGAGDYVTAADRESEDAIRRLLEAETPGVPVLGEEEGGARSDLYWAVDPLDGTTNFMLGLPAVGVSVALVAGGRSLVGAVHAPLLGMEFGAVRGRGAWSGESRLRVSDRPVERAVVAIAFPFRRKRLLPRYLRMFELVFGEAEDVRRIGAACLDLAWVACGALDGFFELSLSEWDVAAGALLVEEAGGVVTDWSGGPRYLDGNILAGTPGTHDLLLRAARQP